MLRAVSVIGSLKSSPSTRTVYSPVIEPLSEVPARSRSLGISEYTLGGYPLVTGGSPVARPISLCAMEKRVSESIIKRTSLPCFLKYSAIAVAVFAALLRINAGLSEVATMTTERFMPSSPRSRSINSRTSLPRSPISAMTLISALVFLANIPSRVLLPTPEPAKIPIRCPLPTVISPSTAFTPSGSTSLIILRFIGSGGAASTGHSSVALIASTSVGRPIPSKVCPNTSFPTKTDKGCPVFSTIHPTPIPSMLSKGISSKRLSLNPTTSAMTYSFSSLFR